MRKIIHIDMDAFFASIEQRDNVNYRGKPVAVGYAGPRGVVAAASYEARQYGVRSAMSSKMALRKCPHLIFTPTRFPVYEAVSAQIMEIFHDYTDLVEPLSLDEAFLDVTNNKKGMQSATLIAKEIRERIFSTTQLTASAGVSFNKFLAKIASDYNKPNGQFLVKPKDAERFVESLKVEQFFGVGRVTAERMHQLGINTGYDLKQKTELELVTLFGKAGLYYYQNARGIDDRLVNPEQIRKSVGAENTFEYDIDIFDDLVPMLEEVGQDVANRIAEINFRGRTISLKIKFANFNTISRSRTVLQPIEDYDTIMRLGKDLLRSVDISPKVRLIGLTLKNSIDDEQHGAIQLSFDFKD